jgi:hypothetical protein
MAPRFVEVILTGNSSQAIAEIEKLVGASEASAAKMGTSFTNIGKVAMIGLAASAVAVAAFSIDMADQFETADARLRTAIKNTGGTFDQYAGQIDKAKSSGEQLGFNNVIVEDSLSRLMVATKNMGVSTRDLSIAEDISRARHIDLTAATDMLVKVEGGRYLALSKTLGVSKEIISSFKTTQDAVDFLAQRFQGQAAAAADTFQGKIGVLVAQMQDLGIKIGQVLIPIIEGMASALMDGVTWLEKHRVVAEALAVIIGGPLVAAMAAWIAKSIAAGASALFDAWAGAATVLMSVVIPSIEAVISSLLAMTAAEAVATLGLSLLAVGIGVVLEQGLSFGTSLTAGWKEASKAGDEWGQKTIATAKAVAAGGGSEIVSLHASLRLLTAGMKEQQDQGTLTTAGMVDYGHQSKALTDEIDRLKVSQFLATVEAKAQTDALNALASGAGMTAAQMNAARTAVDALANSILIAQGGEVGYKLAQIAATDAQTKLTDAVSKYGLGSDEASKAAFEVERANIAVSSSAIKLDADNAKMAATLKNDGIPGLVGMQDELRKTAAARGDDSGAIQGEINHIQTMIDTINFLAGLKPPTVTVTALTDEANAAVHDFLVSLGQIPSDKTTYIHTQVLAMGLSKGGFVPGAGDTDSVPTMLTPGEYVVSKEMQRKGQWGAGAVSGGGASSDGGASGGSGTSGGGDIVIVFDGQTIARIAAKEYNRAGGVKILASAIV